MSARSIRVTQTKVEKIALELGWECERLMKSNSMLTEIIRKHEAELRDSRETLRLWKLYAEQQGLCPYHPFNRAGFCRNGPNCT